MNLNRLNQRLKKLEENRSQPSRECRCPTPRLYYERQSFEDANELLELTMDLTRIEAPPCEDCGGSRTEMDLSPLSEAQQERLIELVARIPRDES